ncbi:MAG: carbamoyl phosphate synthase small subunit [Planctomycetota bacterium]|nr:carbamoyl phosphate synthase small subunit [Planctomycetota bacterium]
MAAPALLLLENEEPLYGRCAGAEGLARGAMVASAFSAGMPDLLTDPAYGGKMVCFTYPHVGTSGVVPDDLQSPRVAARAVIAREMGQCKANRLGVEAMDEWLIRNSIPAMDDADTRTVAGILARRGLVRAVLGTGEFADLAALEKELAAPFAPPENPGVTNPGDWTEEAGVPVLRKVLVYDFGVKRGFLRRLGKMGCALKLVPANHPARDALADRPDAIVFSSGPGVPDDRPEALPAAKELLGKIPLWGIGVGAGLLAAAAGAKTARDGRGHYGVHPVGLAGGPLGEMTTQAHEFQIDEASLAGAGLAATHRNLNDGAVEGFACSKRRVSGVLFNPEGEPGPHDSLHLFDTFMTDLV